MGRSDYYIPVFDSLPGHKKEVALREAMGWNGFESVGFLVWFMLQVAADFPDGELPGLDGLIATLRRVWKAADIKPKRDRLQLVAGVLLREVWVEEVEVDVIVVHDWEDGAGMFAKKREQEKEKKRRQRRAARKDVPEDVPGTAGSCPPDVPGEKEKGKRENIPPSPPQAGGGDFRFFQEQVTTSWAEACAAVGVAAGKDNATIRAMAKLAKTIMEGHTSLEDVRRGMERFLYLKHNPEGGQTAKMATWGANAFAQSFATYIPQSSTVSKSEGDTLVEMECAHCRYVAFLKLRKGHNPDFGHPCLNKVDGDQCTGVMWPVKSR